MVNIDEGNVYITTGTIDSGAHTITGGTTVKIDPTTKVDYVLDNQINVIPSALSGSRRDAGEEPFSRVIDLKRINESFTVQGSLSGDGTSRPIDQLNSLVSLQKTQGTLKIVWGRNPHQIKIESTGANNQYGVYIKQLGFTFLAGKLNEELAADISGNTTMGERVIEVNIQLVRGKDMVGGE